MANAFLPHHQALLALIADVCAGGAILGCLLLIVASVAALHFGRNRMPRPHVPVPVTILKPLRGTEPGLFGRLTSFCNQQYDGQIQIVFGSQDRSDPAIGVVERLAAAFPEKSIALKIDSREHGANRKISNLINMISLAQHEVLIVADSDIEVGPEYLATVVGELQQPGVGAVTCLYHGVAGAGVWSQLSSLAINGHFLPQVMIALVFGLAPACFGATIAIRRQALASIGGFSAFARSLADDFALGEAVRAGGQAVVIPSISIGHVCFEPDFRSLFEWQLRFARTIRIIDPIGYLGLIIMHPLPLALIGLLLGSSGCIYLIVLALGGRLIVILTMQQVFALDRQPYWLAPLQDLLSFPIYIAGVFGATVTWRDKRYRVAPDGSLVQVEK